MNVCFVASVSAFRPSTLYGYTLFENRVQASRYREAARAWLMLIFIGSAKDQTLITFTLYSDAPKR